MPRLIMHGTGSLLLRLIRLLAFGAVAGSLCGSSCVVAIGTCHDHHHDPDDCDAGVIITSGVADVPSEAFQLRDHRVVLSASGAHVRALTHIRGISLDVLASYGAAGQTLADPVLWEFTRRVFVENRELLGYGPGALPGFAGVLRSRSGITVLHESPDARWRIAYTFDRLGRLIAVENMRFS